MAVFGHGGKDLPCADGTTTDHEERPGNARLVQNTTRCCGPSTWAIVEREVDVPSRCGLSGGTCNGAAIDGQQREPRAGETQKLSSINELHDAQTFVVLVVSRA